MTANKVFTRRMRLERPSHDLSRAERVYLPQKEWNPSWLTIAMLIVAILFVYAQL